MRGLLYTLAYNYPIPSLSEIRRRVRSAIEDQKTPRLVALAHEVFKRWPVIRQALENFAALEEEAR